jgi:hypothetical protein
VNDTLDPDWIWIRISLKCWIGHSEERLNLRFYLRDSQGKDCAMADMPRRSLETFCFKGRKSSNSHLVAEAELEAADSYFDKMEKRDEMESKMLSTFEMKTKAVTCHVCNYTSFKVLLAFCFSFLLGCQSNRVKIS